MVAGIDRIFAVSDALDVEHRVVIIKRVEAGVIAERTFAP